MNCRYTIQVALGAALLLGLAPQGSAAAIPISVLRSAADFAVLGASTVTNTGATLLTGSPTGTANLGLWPGTSVTDAGLVTFTNGAIVAGAAAQQAQADALLAYNDLSARLGGTLTDPDLGGYHGLTALVPGIYDFAESAAITGTLELNAQGADEAYWIFQIPSALTTASNASVRFINLNPLGNRGADINVFWLVGTSATLGTDTAFAGNILSETSITMNHGATIFSGRALALGGAVTMDSNTINVVPVPEPSTFSALTVGLAVLCGRSRRRREA